MLGVRCSMFDVLSLPFPKPSKLLACPGVLPLVRKLKLLLLLAPLALSHCTYSKCVVCGMLDYAIEREQRKEEYKRLHDPSIWEEERKALEDQSFLYESEIY